MTKENVKELNEEDLKTVTGGSVEEGESDPHTVGNVVYSGFVKKYAEAYVGSNFYFLKHDGSEYYYGTLMDSFESEYTFYTERVQVVRCHIRNGVAISTTKQLDGDDYWIYRERSAQ